MLLLLINVFMFIIIVCKIAIYLYCVSIKSLPFIFCNNTPSCRPIQIIFGRNITDKIWKKIHMAILTLFVTHH